MTFTSRELNAWGIDLVTTLSQECTTTSLFTRETLTRSLFAQRRLRGPGMFLLVISNNHMAFRFKSARELQFMSLAFESPSLEETLAEEFLLQHLRDFGNELYCSNSEFDQQQEFLLRGSQKMKFGKLKLEKNENCEILIMQGGVGAWVAKEMKVKRELPVLTNEIGIVGWWDGLREEEKIKVWCGGGKWRGKEVVRRIMGCLAGEEEITGLGGRVEIKWAEFVAAQLLEEEVMAEVGKRKKKSGKKKRRQQGGLSGSSALLEHAAIIKRGKSPSEDLPNPAEPIEEPQPSENETEVVNNEEDRIIEDNIPIAVVPAPHPVVESVVAPALHLVVELVVAPALHLVVEPVVQPAPHPVVEPVVAPALYLVVEPIVEPAPHPVVESVVAPALHPVVEPVVALAPHPVVESVVAPAPHSVVEPAVTPAPYPVVEIIRIRGGSTSTEDVSFTASEEDDESALAVIPVDVGDSGPQPFRRRNARRNRQKAAAKLPASPIIEMRVFDGGENARSKLPVLAFEPALAALPRSDVVASISITPYTPARPQAAVIASHPLHSLNTDIQQMAAALEMVAARRQPWQLAVAERVKQVVYAIWPRAWCDVFGSIASGLAAPCSDVDMVIRGVSQSDRVHVLAQHLARCEWVQMLQAVEKTTVPVVNFKTAAIPIAFGNRGNLIAVDITFENEAHHGLNTCGLVRQLVQRWPPLKPLVLVMKQFLVEKGLNDPYVGGLSSYGLILMVAAILRNHWPAGLVYPGTADLGGLLIEFLETYSNRDFIEGGVGLNGDLSKRKRMGDPCFIEDPLDPNNNVGRACFGIHQVIAAFAEALNAIRMYQFEALTDGGVGHATSALGRVFATSHHDDVVRLVTAVWCPPERGVVVIPPVIVATNSASGAKRLTPSPLEEWSIEVRDALLRAAKNVMESGGRCPLCNNNQAHHDGSKCEFLTLAKKYPVQF